VPVVAGAVSERVEFNGGAPLDGKRDGVGCPLGGATESVTACATPLVTVSDVVAVTTAPGITVALAGDNAIAKSNGALTVRAPLMPDTPPVDT
jgi:hypothetical protein